MFTIGGYIFHSGFHDVNSSKALGFQATTHRAPLRTAATAPDTLQILQGLVGGLEVDIN